MPMAKQIIVVGGVAGGMSFATRYRRLNEGDEITIFEKGPFVSFANCGLPYYLSKEIETQDDLLVIDEATLTRRFKLNIRVNHEVIRIDPDKQTVDVAHDGQVTSYHYDELILSPGARPVRLPIKGLDHSDHVFTVRSIPDMEQIKQFIKDRIPRHAVVIGAGFIGLEMAENLHKLGLNVTIIEKASHILPPLDEEMAAYAHQELLRHGLQVFVKQSIVEIKPTDVILEDGSRLPADLIIMAVGVTPETTLAKAAGIQLGMRDGILVNESYQTSIPHIHAIGDAIIVQNIINKTPALIALASPANRQGRQLADNLSGIPHPNRGSLGTAIMRLFSLSIASTGLNERQLADIPHQVMHLFGQDHAGYFPNATPIHLKVIFDAKTKLILGAQAYGEKGVDKRIDILATAIKAGYSVTDLQDLELTYAPPFGTAKDIVNMAGYYAQNLLDQTTETVQWYEVDELVKQGVTLIDLRRTEERKALGYIKSSLSIPLETLRNEMATLPLDKPLIVYCQSGVRSYNGERILKQAGYEVHNLDGSFATYALAKAAEVVHDA